MAFDHGLKPGDIVDNNQLRALFKCGLMGGMRRSHDTNTLVIISDPTRAIYEDRWIEGVFHYTGMGLEGDQSLAFAQNRTLNESDINGVEVQLFEVFEPREYTYRGQVKLAGKPYQTIQPDRNSNPRNVWVFPLKIIEGVSPLIPEELIIKKQEQKDRQARRLTDKELEKRAKNSNKNAGVRQVSTSTYERDPYVAEFARRRAKGICQLCEFPAPFIDKNNNPFLETHHIEWLSEGGEASIENTVALCPNCHRKMHSLNFQSDKEILIKANLKQMNK